MSNIDNFGVGVGVAGLAGLAFRDDLSAIVSDMTLRMTRYGRSSDWQDYLKALQVLQQADPDCIFETRAAERRLEVLEKTKPIRGIAFHYTLVRISILLGSLSLIGFSLWRVFGRDK